MANDKINVRAVHPEPVPPALSKILEASANGIEFFNELDECEVEKPTIFPYVISGPTPGPYL